MDARWSIENVFDAALDAVVAIDARGAVVGWNLAAERLFGWTKADAAGRCLAQLILPEPGRGRAQEALAAAVADRPAGLIGERGEHVVTHRDGREFVVEASVFATRLDGHVVITAFLRDITDRLRAEQLRTAEHAVVSVLAGAHRTRDVAPVIARIVATGLSWPLAEIWIPAGADRSVRMASWPARDADGPLAAFASAGRTLVAGRGVGIVGQAWERREIVTAREHADIGDAARMGQVGGAVAVPIVARDKVVAVIALFDAERRTLGDDERGSLETMGDALGQFAGRRIAERRLEAETEAVAAVARATRRLAASSHAEETRTAIVEATLEVCGGALAALVELDADGELAFSALGGEPPLRPLDRSARIKDPSIFHEVHAAGECRVITDPGLVGPDGAPIFAVGIAGGMIQPIRRGDEGIGLLMIGWRTRIDHISAQLSQLTRLLADEAAIALSRVALVTDLRTAAHTEPLTGLPNLRAWDEQLGRELARAQRTERPMAVVVLDLDDLKTVNDAGGHQAGDRLLRAAVAAWQAELRQGDILARTGGDEFAILLPDCTLTGAQAIADRVREATPDEHTTSAGVAQWNHRETGPELVARADGALYEAKHAGRDRVVAAS